jgi:hypothetical protein
LIKQKVLFSPRSSTCFITKNHGHHYFIPKRKVKVKCRSNFDSWGGMLSPVDYQEFSWKYINQIVEALADDPVIVFGKGCWFALGEMGKAALLH